MPLFPRPALRLVSPLLVAGALAAAALAAFPAPAGAQDESFDIGGDLEMILELPDDDDGYSPPNPPDIIEFMNRANCACGGEDSQFAVEFRLNNPAATLPDEELQVWLGVACDSTDPDIQDRCQRVDGFSDLEELRGERDRLISVRDLISKDGTCPEQENERSVYAIVDEDGDGLSDFSENLEIPTDTRPPPEPTVESVTGGEDSIRISWNEPASTEDIWYYQALCLREDGQPADNGFSRGDAEYLTAAMQCEGDDGTCVRTTSLARSLARGGVDGGVDADAGVDPDAGAGDPDGGTSGSECATDVPEELADLDPTLLCASQAAPATSLEIKGLTNGVTYRVVLLVIDRARNVTALDVGSAKPEPVIDFWEDYKAQGGRAKGGCGVGQAGPGAGILVGFGLALWVGAARRRRRRGGPTAAGLVLLAGLGLAPRLADAQPWWESYGDPVQAEVGPAPPLWNLELKLGPYVPDIDSEFDLGADEAGPVERMFGDGPFLLGGITLDRYLLHPLGQLGVSASLGFLTRSANAFKIGEDGMTVDENDDERPDRAPGNTTTLRLFPASLGVVYRFTELDDRFRIPLVPYGRLGLSYYYWWITRPSGGTAEAPTPDCPDLEDCEGEPGRGGSLGWQATVGIAVRAERIDPDAEQSLRNELGIEHAGLVFEYTYAVVDGFGSDEKLSVGDATWFGGLNFEF